MEKVKILTKLDYRTLKYCNLFLMKFQKRTKIWFVITALLSIGVALYAMFYMEDNKNMFIILAVAFVLYSGYQFLTLEKKLDKSLVRFFYNRRLTSQTIELDESNITVTRSADPENPVVYDWSFVTEICEMPQFYMLMIGKGAPIIIDRSNEAILEGYKETLDRIIAQKAEMKPHKKTEIDIVKIPITYVHQEFPAEDVIDVDNTVVDALEIESVVEDAESDDKKNSEDNDRY